MKWTGKQPTKAGFYWYWEENRTVVLEVREGMAKGHWFTWNWQQGRFAQYPMTTIQASGVDP